MRSFLEAPLSVLDAVLAWLARSWAAAPLFFKIVFPIAFTVTVTELLLKRFAPQSKALAGLQRGMTAFGAFWTGVVLSIVYFLSVPLANLALRASGQDPLDRKLEREPTFWRKYEPSPLSPLSAARHQF